MMNQIANITLFAAALLDMLVLLGRDITAHRDNGHDNTRYYDWMKKSGEILSPKRLLPFTVFIATFTTMAQQSWIVVMILAATLLIQAIALLKGNQWRLMVSDKRTYQMLALALFLVTLVGVFVIPDVFKQTDALLGTQVMAQCAVMLLVLTPFLTMLVAWMLKKGRKVNGPEQPDQQD